MEISQLKHQQIFLTIMNNNTTQIYKYKNKKDAACIKPKYDWNQLYHLKLQKHVIFGKKNCLWFLY